MKLDKVLWILYIAWVCLNLTLEIYGSQPNHNPSREWLVRHMELMLIFNFLLCSILGSLLFVRNKDRKMIRTLIVLIFLASQRYILFILLVALTFRGG